MVSEITMATHIPFDSLPHHCLARSFSILRELMTMEKKQEMRQVDTTNQVSG